MNNLGLYDGRPVKRVMAKNVHGNEVEYVPVVRCKDCQFYLNRGRNCWCDIFDSITPENHFCSYGERKDNE